MRNLLCLLAAALLGHSVAAQTAPRPAATPPRDTGTGSPVIIDYAEVFDYIVTDTAAIQRLSGEVELRQDSAFIYADTASIFDDNRGRGIRDRRRRRRERQLQRDGPPPLGEIPLRSHLPPRPGVVEQPSSTTDKPPTWTANRREPGPSTRQPGT